MDIRDIDVFHLEEALWLGIKNVGVSAYDFKYEPLFCCRRPYELPKEIELICRIGAFEDYESSYRYLINIGFTLINNIEEHYRASELDIWYPLIEQYTPRSVCYDEFPDYKIIENDFDYPVFIKGSRQTAKHNEGLSVAKNTKECIRILNEYRNNAILHWQKLVCREFVELMPVDAISTDKVAPSFEFRSFWYKGKLVGVGHYWSDLVQYNWTKEQESEALSIATIVCKLMDVPFLVIDLALTKAGKWIVIECNDGQESGYSGVEPIVLWKKIIEFEKNA